MQFASPSGRLALARGQLWSRARSSVGGGVLWSALIVFLLTYAIASSTSTAGWVSGIEVIPLVALGGALLMAVLAVLPVPWPTALGLGMVLGPLVALIAAGPALPAAHPFDPALVGAGGLSLRIVSVWWGRLTDGEAANDPSFYLFLICWLMWVTGAWLSWCVLRWRKPMLGLLPGAESCARQVDRRRALGLLGERACGDGCAHRAGGHAAPDFHRGSHHQRGVEPLHELGAAAAKAQPPRGRRRDRARSVG